MKKLLTLLFAMALTLSLSAVSFAQDQGATETKEAKKEAKKEKKAKKKEAKHEMKEMQGEKKAVSFPFFELRFGDPGQRAGVISCTSISISAG
jgi:uncharacterized protein HemX